MNEAAASVGSPAIFLDRDGTIMRDVEYCADPAHVEILPGATSALRALKHAGFKLIVITNQSGIGRGYFGEAEYRAVEHELAQQLGGDVIAATYFCPDAPDAESTRRKPEPAMIFEAARDYSLDLSHSFFIGDKQIDSDCGRNAGMRTILVQTGRERNPPNAQADWVVSDLAEAAAIILKHGA